MKIDWNLHAFEELRRTPEVTALLEKAAKRVADHAGDGFEFGVESGRSRERGYVVAATPEAANRNASDHTLTTALSQS